MNLNIEIREVGTKDISQLERLFPQGGAEKHARRLVRQQNGSAVYLIAFLAETARWTPAVEIGTEPDDEAVLANPPGSLPGSGIDLLRP